MIRKNLTDLMSHDSESTNRIRIGHYTQRAVESQRIATSKKPLSLEERAIAASRSTRKSK